MAILNATAEVSILVCNAGLSLLSMEGNKAMIKITCPMVKTTSCQCITQHYHKAHRPSIIRDKALIHRPHRLSPGRPNQRLHQWRAVQETGSTGPHVPARGAWCTRAALKSSSAFPQSRGNRPVAALARVTIQQSLSGTSCADAPDRRVAHLSYRAVREGHLLGRAHRW